MTVRVAFAAPDGAEADAAWTWLGGCDGVAAARVTLAGAAAAAPDADVVWIHADTALEGVNAGGLAEAVAGGLRLVLTLRASSLAHAMRLDTVPPNDVVDVAWHHDADEFYTDDFRASGAYPHVRGLAAYGAHPLFDGLRGGTYTWAPVEGERWVRCAYRRGARPANGRVIAVERAYSAQNPARVVAWEYPHPPGHVLCIGAYVYFAARDGLLRPQLERMIRNALADDGASERCWWPEPATAASPSEALVVPEPLDLDGRLGEPDDDPIVLDGPVEAAAPWDLAGRRALLVGDERRGIRELWLHPHRALSAWEVSADAEPATGAHLAVTPDLLVRALDTSRRRLTETCFVALEHAAAVLDYRMARKGRESVGREAAVLAVEFTVDLRRTWPFAAGCGGNLRFRRRPDGTVVMVESESGDGVVAVFLSRPCEVTLRGVHEGDVPEVECRLVTPLGVPLRIAVLGGRDRDDFQRTIRAVRRLGIAGLARQRNQRAVTIREARLAVRAPDERLPRAVEWAKRRLDLFLGDVPGVGRSLFAGYAPTDAGWGHGRPGYAWFFGRDACWSAFALLAAGEHSIPRQVLRFLGDTQDVTGKVIHEVTTSGQCHYDAADSTPLYLLLAARYLAWTGDRDFVASAWPRLERALRFCLSTDRDGDGLIENTRVGHGWIEGGPLGGAHVTLYLAAVWKAALEGLARVAEAVGEKRAAAECWACAARAGTAIEADFYGDAVGGYALDRRPDGSKTWTPTALQSVALLLGAANPLRAAAYLDALGSSDFSADWGVRMLPASDQRFRPDAYHAGAVWPLFTGWAALAEYRSGRAQSAFRHVMANALLPLARQRGAFDEVLHGQIERGAGVCPDQAWSAAMMIAPVVEGLLGVQPDAPHGKLLLSPCLPDGWTWLDVTGLRCGESAYDLRLRRRPDALEVRVRRVLGAPLWLTLAPWCARPPSRVEVDGSLVRPVATTLGATVRPAVSFQATGEHEVRFAE